MSSSLSQNILATIAYYDVLDYPLTVFELWKYLISDPAYAEALAGKQDEKKILIADIIRELEGEELKKQTETYRGFYFLPGRKDLVSSRIERNKISEEKYKIILRMMKLLKFIPHIKMVAVVGRVAMKNSEKKSDLDLLIVFEKGHIFTGRFLTVALLSILGKRRSGKKIKNKICLNHFLSTNFSVSVQDLFSSHEYVFMLPIFGFEMYQNFFVKNAWIKNYRPNFESKLPIMKEEKDSQFSKKSREILEKICSFQFIEKILKKMQIEKILKNPKTQKTGGVIIYSDDELAFWPDFEKQGPRVFEEFKKRLENFS
jgi:predicted nucleotidyltransferase